MLQKHEPDTDLSMSQAYVPPIHKFAPETIINRWETKCEGSMTEANLMQKSLKWTYHRWLVVSVQYDDEICDSQHSCNEKGFKTRENLDMTEHHDCKWWLIR